MIRALFDTNVLLDIALARPEFANTSLAAYSLATEKGPAPLIAPHSLSTFYYLVRQSHDKTTAAQSVEDLLTTGEIATFDQACAISAKDLDFPDFEDAMIAACAHAAGAERIVTRNLNDFQSSPVTACSPEAFLEEFQTA